ncbi:MAG: hypothetical protein RR202_08820 [Bacteroidales bacterium]
MYKIHSNLFIFVGILLILFLFILYFTSSDGLVGIDGLLLFIGGILMILVGILLRWKDKW